MNNAHKKNKLIKRITKLNNELETLLRAKRRKEAVDEHRLKLLENKKQNFEEKLNLINHASINQT